MDFNCNYKGALDWAMTHKTSSKTEVFDKFTSLTI